MANKVVSTSKWYCFFLLNPAVTASFFETLAGGLAQPRAADFPAPRVDPVMVPSRGGAFSHLAPPTVRELNTRSSPVPGVFGIERKAGPGTPYFFSTRGE